KTKKASEIEGSNLWIGGEVLDRDLNDYDAYKEYLGNLAAKKIRLQSGWAKTETKKGVYDFAWLDHIVDDALSRGVQPWIQISYGNPIYPGGGGASLGQGLITSDKALEAFAAYAEVLVNRYKDRVYEWEIWNEADLRHNAALGHDENTYAKLFVKTVAAVKRAQPEAKIVALSLAGVGRVEFVDGFFQYLKDKGKVDWVDVITYHGYPRNPDHGFDNVAKLEATATKYKKDIEFWQGETGCPSTFGSTGALSGYEWTELTQAKWNTRRALAHVGRGHSFSLFLLSEFVYNDALRKGLNSKGILKIDETDRSIKYAKPAYYAYQNLTSVLDHRMERLPALPIEIESDSSTAVFAFRHKLTRSPMVFLWQDGHIPSHENVPMKTNVRIEGIRFRDPLLVDMLSGAIYELSNGAYANNNNTSTFLDLPVYDAPIMIVDRTLIGVQ
ncbi:MAG: hypothetical protein AAFX53_16395, partial [Bacteroidota bacterium]